MQSGPKRSAVLTVVLFLLPALAYAGALQDARNANSRGDYKAALQILQPLANQGNAEAQFELGFMYWLGHGVNRNWRAAAQWYHKSAEQGNLSAQVSLGVIYTQDGFGIKQDYTEAAKWDRIAAEYDSASAFNLGQLYLQGHGVPQDYVEAYFWLSVGAREDDEKVRLHEAEKLLTPEQKAAVDKRLVDWARRIGAREAKSDNALLLPIPPK